MDAVRHRSGDDERHGKARSGDGRIDHVYSHYTINERSDGLVAMSLDGQIKWKTDQQPAFVRGGSIAGHGELGPRSRGARRSSPDTDEPKARKLAERVGQAVRLPKEYQFSTAEVFIRKEGDDVILSPRPRDWRSYLDTAPVASDTFMTDVEDLPVQEREG